MRVLVIGVLLACAWPASAASFGTDEAVPGVTVPALPVGVGIALLQPALSVSLPEAAPASVLAAQSAVPALPAAQVQAAAAEGAEPTEEDVKATRLASILRNPAPLPPRVAKLIERELGLFADHPLFDSISRSGAQPRNANTNAPLGEAHAPVNPTQTLAGLFQLRQESRAYYDSLKNRRTGVTATGVRGGVDAMTEALLEKGYLPPRSQGRNLRFKNGVYMDLPSFIHQARKWATVDPHLAQGKDRYPMVMAFRAANVRNPGTDYQGRIVGDGGTLGQVALDPVTPQDVVSIYVPKNRVAQTIERLKGTALAHVQVYPMDILPQH